MACQRAKSWTRMPKSIPQRHWLDFRLQTLLAPSAFQSLRLALMSSSAWQIKFLSVDRWKHSSNTKVGGRAQGAIGSNSPISFRNLRGSEGNQHGTPCWHNLHIDCFHLEVQRRSSGWAGSNGVACGKIYHVISTMCLRDNGSANHHPQKSFQLWWCWKYIYIIYVNICNKI